MAVAGWKGDIHAMSQNLFTPNTIAVIWDFDKTLSPGYMQEPLFKRYGVDPTTFWQESNGLDRYYLRAGSKRVSKDTLYLNHILTYVRRGIFRDLNNALLRELGAEIQFYDGIPEFFEEAKRCVMDNTAFAKHDISVEHYIVSTGLREMIMGSKVGPFMDEVWACEFVEVIGEPGYLKQAQANLFDGQDRRSIVDVGYVIDNTTKTRAIFEINKGTNQLSDIDVNATVAHEDRRIPFQNMIYVADGPSDIPAFSIINQYGGATFAVYKAGDEAQFKQVVNLQNQKRVQGIGEANYTQGSLTSMWLTNAIESIASRIVEDRERLLHERVGQSPRHIISDATPAKPATVSGVARIAVESAEAGGAASPATSEESLPAPPQRARDKAELDSADAAPAA
jgi:hypothetical protein